MQEPNIHPHTGISGLSSLASVFLPDCHAYRLPQDKHLGPQRWQWSSTRTLPWWSYQRASRNAKQAIWGAIGVGVAVATMTEMTVDIVGVGFACCHCYRGC
ncbi:hypothetical protein ACMFMF_004464 [Clarireedia jacksonii]